MSLSLCVPRYLIVFSILITVPTLSTHARAPHPRGDLTSLLGPIRNKHNLPALAGVIVVNGEIAGIGVVGMRRAGYTERATISDKWHLGSNTKSMTATLLAVLVEQGKLSWSTTLEQAFPGLRAEMDPTYRNVTLEQLLTHRGGVPADVPPKLWEELWRRDGTPTQQRMTLVQGILKIQPQAPPGHKYIYSNSGYAIAGAMAEKALGQSWEDLMRTYLFTPLEMGSADFGAPGDAGKMDQPWGHVVRDGKAEPVPPSPDADNPPAIGPAGTVHASLKDWAKYTTFHLAGARGEGQLLRPSTFQKLHTPLEGQDYALGWISVHRDWAGGPALTHAGSNTMWYAIIWLAPRKNFGVLTITNIGGDKAAKACDEAVAALIQHVLSKVGK